MAPYDNTTPETRLDSFNVYETHFKHIGDHKINVAILVPKDLKPSKVPLAVKFHGGGLVTGDALFAEWISAWLVPLMHRNNSIMVLPNYRLTPEASGADILQDMHDFWTWIHDKGVDTYLASQGVELDLDYGRLLVLGDSAGGYMAVQSGLTRPKGEIKAILAQYPMVDCPRPTLDSRIMGEVAPPTKEWLDENLAAVMKPGAILSSSHPFASGRFLLFFGLNVYKRFDEFFGVGKELWPITAIEDASYLPPTTIFHATGDTVVDYQDSVRFVEKMKSAMPDVEVRLTKGKEGDHGFDGELKEDEEEWLKTDLQWLESKWLA